MPRPNLSPEKWGLIREIVSSVDYQSHPAAEVLGPRGVEEFAYAGVWLNLELMEDGAPEAADGPVADAYGERASTGCDPWDVAQDILRRWRMGLPLTSASEAN